MTEEEIIMGVWGLSFWIAFLVGLIKGRGLFGFLLGITTGPIGAIVIVCFPSATKACDACQKKIPVKASKCPYCQTVQK